MELSEGVEATIPSLCKLALEALGVWKTKILPSQRVPMTPLDLTCQSTISRMSLK